jgi:wobble nucleotide-excising tRNase
MLRPLAQSSLTATSAAWLAFFLAKALHEESCAASMVVLDDVFASLDSNRRSQTIAALCEVAKKCAQVIVLAHDAYFLYELEGHDRREGAGGPSAANSPCG